MDNNLSQYKIFYTTAGSGSISAAAKELYISQPAISKSIAKLEESLKTTLFTRTSRGVSLTEEGELLYSHLSHAFESIHFAETELQRMTTLGVGHLRIGVSTMLCQHVLLPLLKDFVSRHPHIKITIECQPTNQTLSMLEDKKIDIGLIARPEKLGAFHFYSLGQIEDIFVATPTYLNNLSIREGENSSDIFKYAMLMLLDKDNRSRKYIDQYIQKNAIETGDLIEISSMEMLIEFAKINLGIACVVKEFVHQELKDGTFVEVPLRSKIEKREIGFAYAKSEQKSQSLVSFLDALSGFSFNL